MIFTRFYFYRAKIYRCKDRERERKRGERDRQRYRDRNLDRQKQTDKNRQKDRDTERQTQTGGETHRQTYISVFHDDLKSFVRLSLRVEETKFPKSMISNRLFIHEILSSKMSKTFI